MRSAWIGTLVLLLPGVRAEAADEDLAARIDALTRELRRLEERLEVPGGDDEAPGATGVHGGSGLSIGGYGELTFEHPTAGDEPTRGDFQRLVLYVGRKFSDRIVMSAEIEFEHATTGTNFEGEEGEVALEQGFLDFLLSDAVNVRAGDLLLPMGFVNRIHEPPFFRGVARPEVERRLIPTTWRELGAGVYGEAAEGLRYDAYLVNGLDADGFDASGIRGGRQEANQVLWEDSAVVLALDLTRIRPWRLGASFYRGGADQGRSFDGGDVSVTATVVEGHAEVKRGGFEGRALAVAVRIGGAGAVSRELSDSSGVVIVPERQAGWYLEGAYDVGPPLGLPTQAQLLGWMRWEDWDLQRKVPAGDPRDPAADGSALTVGLELKPRPTVSIKADWTLQSTKAGGETPDPLRLGLGFVF